MDKEKESENLQLSSDEVAMRVGLLTDLLQCGTQMVVNSGPLIITTKYGLMWSVIYEQDEDAEADLLYTLGPVLSSPLMEETIADILKNPQIRASWKPKFIRYLKAIKTIPVPEFFRDTMMLHYCVTGRYIKASEMTFHFKASKSRTTLPPAGAAIMPTFSRSNPESSIISAPATFIIRKRFRLLHQRCASLRQSSASLFLLPGNMRRSSAGIAYMRRLRAVYRRTPLTPSQRST